MVDLLLGAFHRWPAFEIQVPALEHLRWKLRSDPVSARHQYVAEADGRIVATYLRIVCRVRVSGRSRVARHDVDVAVDSHYRDRGLYGAMVDHALGGGRDSEFALGFWYSTNPRTRLRRTPDQQRREFENPIQVLQKSCNARAIVARSRARYGGRLPAPIAVLRIKLEAAINRLGHWPYWRPAKHSWSITTQSQFDDRIEGFFEEAARPFDFMIVRGKDYMNWRYCDPAAGRFTVRTAEERGKLLGYLVFKIAEGEGYITDLLALPGRIDVARSLVEDALRLFREARVERINCWMVRWHPYNHLLKRCGFVDSRKDVGFRMNPIDLTEAEIELLTGAKARIHLTQGDSDWV
jgi:hypothetical protein